MNQQTQQTQKSTGKVTPIGRISFPNLFQAQQINGQGEPKFGCTLVFDPDADLREMRQAVQQAINKKWNGVVPNNYKDPFLDGDTMNRPEYKGKIIVRFSSKADKRPQIVGAMKEPLTDPADVYSGCYCKVSYGCYAWTFAGKSGVSFGLGHVQRVRHGARFDGRGTADSVFSEIDEGEAGFDTEDEDIPF